MHLVRLLPPLPTLNAYAAPAVNATEAHDMFLEVLPIRVIPMLDRIDDYSRISSVNSTVSTTCILGSIVVILQMTVILRGAIMRRIVKPFVVDHFISRSKEFYRFTPVLWDFRNGALGHLMVRWR